MGQSKGFTLIEAAVTLCVIAILIAATTMHFIKEKEPRNENVTPTTTN